MKRPSNQKTLEAIEAANRQASTILEALDSVKLSTEPGPFGTEGPRTIEELEAAVAYQRAVIADGKRSGGAIMLRSELAWKARDFAAMQSLSDESDAIEARMATAAAVLPELESLLAELKRAAT